MGFEVNGPDLGVLTASADLSANIFYAGVIGSGGQVGLPTLAGQRVDGILMDKSKANDPVRLARDDCKPCIYGGTVTAGDSLCVNSSGQFVTAVGAEFIVGRAVVSGVVNDIGTILITMEGYSPVFDFVQHMELAQIAAGTMPTDLVLGLPAGSRITGMFAIVDVAATTASKAATLQWEINLSPGFSGYAVTTGGVLALTSANMTPRGNVVAATAITALNSFGPLDRIALLASSVTAFVEGEIELHTLIART